MKVGGYQFQPLIAALLRGVVDQPGNVAALMDLTIMLQFRGLRQEALEAQRMALQAHQLYWFHPGRAGGIRLLAFVAGGDMAANAPIEYLIEGTDITLIKLYVGPGLALPTTIPPHDVAITIIGEADEARAALATVARLRSDWPCTVLNDPERIAQLARDRLCHRFQDAAAIVVPATVRAARTSLEQVAAGALDPTRLAPDLRFPMIVRPRGSHAGKALHKIDDPAALTHYLAGTAGDWFYASRFVDYRDADGRYRKSRIAFVAGEPLLCHVAISDHWMVHYMNAGMFGDADKRAEEAGMMATFDSDFSVRHAGALRTIAERIGLDYFSIDCATLRDGSLILFEGGCRGGGPRLRSARSLRL
ncbi:MAG: RimK family alpha-L-glutamate ligase [Pseudomonadota bacterium]